MGIAGLKMLQEKEADLRKALASESDPAKQKELEHNLQTVLMKQKDLQAKLKELEAPLPPTPPTPPVPPTPPAKFSADDLAKMLLEVQAKEKAVQAELEKTSDPEQAAKMKDILKKLAQKQEDIKAKLEQLKNISEEK
ncbi:MAG: hypothetical protein A2Y56_06930 [Candidatus Aminicenantes bacterium RBG_13_63_10]|nr:MAG: hypothetical protein A2Y56_06930 [Candidatus Aminicenantes bacterium RBG_13_63_10]